MFALHNDPEKALSVGAPHLSTEDGGTLKWASREDVTFVLLSCTFVLQNMACPTLQGCCEDQVEQCHAPTRACHPELPTGVK